jgi:hypothetical protein
MINYSYISSAKVFGQAYSCGAYGSGAYSAGECGTTPATGGGLADTGYNILLPLALGAALIIAAAILIVKRIVRKRRANHSV